MIQQVQLRCHCGQVRGQASHVSPTNGFRLTCYCRDCQAFAHFLGRGDILNQAGGIDIFQLPPARIVLSAGAEVLGCVSISKKVLRWYCDCCKTPLANTAAQPGIPIVGLIHSFMIEKVGGPSRRELLGPSLCSLFEGSATGPLPANSPGPPSLATQLRRMLLLLRWMTLGLARPSPFFSDFTQSARAAARTLVPE